MIDPACSFCGKTQRVVSKLLANGEAMICDECVLLCVEIIIRDPTSQGTLEWLGRLRRRIARVELDRAQQPQNLN